MAKTTTAVAVCPGEYITSGFAVIFVCLLYDDGFNDRAKVPDLVHDGIEGTSMYWFNRGQ